MHWLRPLRSCRYETCSPGKHDVFAKYPADPAPQHLAFRRARLCRWWPINVTHEDHAWIALQAAVTGINDILMELQEAEENILDEN